MKMTKRLLAVLLTLCMVVALVPTMMFASSAAEAGTVSVVDTSAQLGEATEVTVTVVADGAWAEEDELLVAYDTTAFSWSDAESEDDDLFEISKGSKKQGYAIVVDCWTEDEYTDTTVGTVTLEIAEDAAAGDYEFTVDGEVVGTVTLLPAFEYEGMTFRIIADKTELVPGDTVTLTYKIYGIPATGLTEFEFFNVFDEDAFEFVSASVPSSIEGLTLYGTVNESQKMLCGTVSPDHFLGNSVLGTATFLVKDDAATGEYVFDIDRTEQDPASDAWKDRPTTFSYCEIIDGEKTMVPMPTPAVATATVTVTGTVEPPVEPTVYTVNWVVEGTIVATASFEEGEAEPTYAGATPEKAADETYTYEFDCWEKSEEGTTITYTAQFIATEIPAPVVYTVKYVVEGEVVFEETFEEGTEEPAYTETPTKAEDMFHTYEFSEWYKTEEGTTITYTALFIANDKVDEPTVYTVKYVVEGEVVFEETFEEGTEEPAYTETPAKAATAQYTYTFTEWTKSVEGEVITYTAEFTETVNKYVVTFKDGAEVLAEVEYEYGATIDYVAPAKIPTAEYTYTFEKFEPALAVVTGEATYQVIYTATEIPPVEPADKAVTFETVSAQLGETTEVTITLIANGSFEEEEEISIAYDTETFTYSDAESADEDLFEISRGSKKDGYPIVVIAYTEDENTDTTVGTVTLEIADGAVAGDYEFTVDGEVVGVVTLLPAFEYEGMTFRILSDKTVVEPGDTFTLTYKIYGIPATGLTEYEFFNIFDEDTFEFVSATIPSSIEGLTNYGTVNVSQKMLCGTVSPDHFLGDSVLGTATFKVKDTAAAGDYLFDIDRTEQDPADPAWKACPTTFSHCEVIDGTKTMVPYLTPAVATATVTVAGTVEPPVEPTVYTVTYVVEGTVVFEETYEDGEEMPVYTETPTKAEDETYTYEFAGWDEVTDEDGNTVFTALFTATEKPVEPPVEPTVYTVKYVVEGTVVLEETFEEGTTEPTYTETPTKAEDETYTYEFKEWTKTEEGTVITYTAEFTATEKQVEPPVEPKTITIEWVVDGEVVYTATYTEGEEEPEFAGETPTKAADDKNTYTFTGWEKTVAEDGTVSYAPIFKATPKTNDVYNTVLWVVLMVSCAAVVAVAFVAKKKIED